MKRSRLLPALLGLALLAAPLGVAPAEAAVTQTGTYHPVTASRLLDTRKAIGAPNRPIGAGQTLTLQVGGRGGVPASGVAAVVVNLTATNATSTQGFLSVYPAGTSRGSSSSLNFGKGRNTATGATVPVSSDGKVVIYNSAGSTDVLVDIAGWYAGTNQGSGGTDYLTQDPTRVLDTRVDFDDPLPGLASVSAGIQFDTAEANQDVRALAVNITAVDGQRTGFLTAWDGVSTTVPNTSSLNFEAKNPVANSAVVKVRRCGDECVNPEARVFSIANGSQGSVNVLVDVFGVFVDSSTQDSTGMRFVPIKPTRIASSGRGGANPRPLLNRETRTITVGSVADEDTITLVTNATALSPTAKMFFTLWSTGERPTTSNLNAIKGRTVSNGAYVDLTNANTFQIFNSAGSTHFAIDVTGKFELAPYASGSAQARTAARGQGAGAGRQVAPARLAYTPR